MNAFLDTSALIKLYHAEAGSERLTAYIEEQVDTIFLSELATLEFRSAIWRRVRMREIEQETALRVIACFDADADNYTWIAIQSGLVRIASDLFNIYGAQGLRTLDALQLASALMVKKNECVFFTSDNLLRSFFSMEGLSVIEL